MKILAINPGSTSTKIAVFEDEKSIFSRTLRHSVEELTRYPRIIDQFEFRKNLVVDELKADGIPFEFDAIVGRGGLLKPIPGGVYEVNDAMLNDIMHAMRTHASAGWAHARLASHGFVVFAFPKLYTQVNAFAIFCRFPWETDSRFQHILPQKQDYLW